VARELGTSTPRVVRAARRLGVGESGAGGRLRLDADDARHLRDELGASPSASGFSPTQLRVLAVASRAPLGITSAREIARRAWLSPTAAARAVGQLEGRELLVREPGLDRQPRLVFNWEHPDARALRLVLARVVLPKRKTRERRVPRRLKHLFWNTAPSQLDVERAGPYIATRLLRTLDPEGLAWGARALSPADWTAGARARGLSPEARALAENLAEAER
jgi:hypothetical protein